MIKKKIFITGATGFIGQQLALRLADEGHKVIALIRTPSRASELRHNNISFVVGDLFNLAALEEGLQRADEVYHLAAFAQVWAADDSFYQTNVVGTENLLATAKYSGVAKVLLVSTAGAIGPSINGPATEETKRTVDFFNNYERTKFQSEEVARKYAANGLHVVITNLTRVYGPGLMSMSNAVTFMIRQYIKGKWKLMPGDGKANGNYVFIDDAVHGQVLAMENGRAGERYIIGGEDATYEQFFDTLARCHGQKYRLIKIPFKILLAIGKGQSYLADNFKIAPKFTAGWVRKFLYDWSVSSAKAEKELGYRYKSLAEGIDKTLEWLRANDQ